MAGLTQETIDQLRRAGFTTALGLKYYDLQEQAKQVVPVVTPLVNSIPRVKGKGDTSTNWKTITGINTGKLSSGVGEGHRNAFMTTTMVDKSAAYKTIGLDDFVTEEADWAGVGFDNLPAIVKRNLLLALKIQEERVMYAGQGTWGLSTSPTPTVTTQTTGGSITDSTAYSVYIVSLTHAGYQASSVANGVRLTTTRSNAGGTTDTQAGGYGATSSAGTVTTGAPGTNANKLTWSVTWQYGAVAYAVYVGTSAGTARLYTITTLPGGTITSIPTTTQLLSALAGTDQTQDSLVFDGLLGQLSKSDFAGYQARYAGTSITADGGAGIVEYNTAFAWFWDNWKLSPSKIYVSAAKAIAIDKAIVANGGAPILRVNTTPGGAIQTGRGGRVTSVLNKATNTEVELIVHPDATDTTDIFASDSVPFPSSNIGSPVEMHMQRDYYGRDWPMINRQYEYGVYARGCMPIYADGAFGIVQGLAP